MTGRKPQIALFADADIFRVRARRWHTLKTMYRIMTVCTGNICRSPVGEYLIREHARQAGLEVEVASSAITDY